MNGNGNKGGMLKDPPTTPIEVNGNKRGMPKDSAAITTAIKVLAGVFLLVGLALAGLFVVGYLQQQGQAEQALQEQQQANEDLQRQLEDVQAKQEEQAQDELQKQLDEAQQSAEEAQAKAEEAQQQANQQPQVVVAADGAPEGVVVTSPDYTYSGSEAGTVLDAAIAYYQAAELGDYETTYSLLSYADQDVYTLDEWIAANTALDSAASEFVVYNVEPQAGYSGWYWVDLTVYLADDSSVDRRTEFVYEDGVWHHYLTTEETQMFNEALGY